MVAVYKNQELNYLVENMVTTEIPLKSEIKVPLSKPAKKQKLAVLAKKILEGSDYVMIENPASYREFYKERIACENQDFNITPRISDFGLFDTSVIKKPKQKNGKLVFYALKRPHNLPYKVTCKLKNSKMKCELLSYESSHPQKLSAK